jgi:tetratricopeptide (TPR) repeat protein
VLEAGGSGEGIEKTLAGAASPAAAVPAALHAALMARLDRLGRVAKEVAQIAAAIGREFSYELVAPVAERGEVELQDALGRLGEAGLIFSRGVPPYATYLFKHALVGDAAYASLLRRRREQLHARIAAVLEADFPDRIALEPELLARHLTEAGLLERAVRYWLRAGERATDRLAYLEAIAHLKRGIEIVARLPESRERDEQELFLQAALLPPYGANEGYASAALKQAAKRAVDLGGRIGVESPAQIQAVWAHNWLALVYMHRGELRTALTIGEEGFGLAERLGDRLIFGQMHHRVGEVGFYLGHLPAARRHFEEGLALYDPERDRATAARLGYDLCMGCHAWLGFTLWDQGFPAGALRHGEEAIAAARAAAHPMSEAWALTFVAWVHLKRGEVALCLDRAKAAFALATEQVLSWWALSATRFPVGLSRTRVKRTKDLPGCARGSTPVAR